MHPITLYDAVVDEHRRQAAAVARQRSAPRARATSTTGRRPQASSPARAVGSTRAVRTLRTVRAAARRLAAQRPTAPSRSAADGPLLTGEARTA